MTSPVRLVVAAIWAGMADNGVDLDAQKTITRPKGIDDWPEAKRRQWFLDHGHDLFIDIHEKGICLMAVNTNLALVQPERWDEKDLSWISRTLEPGCRASPLIFWELPPTHIPAALAFRVADGAAGLFRVEGYSAQDRTITLQVRLSG